MLVIIIFYIFVSRYILGILKIKIVVIKIFLIKIINIYYDYDDFVFFWKERYCILDCYLVNKVYWCMSKYMFL